MWNEQLLKYGTELIIMRSEFIKELNPLIAEIHAGLSGGKETLSIAYEPNVSPENFREQLAKNQFQEIRQRQTLTGPHRDDLNFIVNGTDIRRLRPRTAENGSSFFKTCGDRAGEKDRKGLSGASSG